MNAYQLPTALNVGGTEYPVRTDFRDILNILISMSDPNMEAWEKQEVMYRIVYPDWQLIPASAFSVACEKAVEFIDYTVPDSRPKPRTMDWQQDAAIIIPAINKVAGKEVRAAEYLHWWTFMGYFMEIEDGMFSQVLSIRQKKARGKKLENWEREFERNNAELVKLKKVVSVEQQKEKDSIMRWL